jgi:hypothetical protein
MADRVAWERARAFHVGKTPPMVSRFIDAFGEAAET